MSASPTSMSTLTSSETLANQQQIASVKVDKSQPSQDSTLIAPQMDGSVQWLPTVKAERGTQQQTSSPSPQMGVPLSQLLEEVGKPLPQTTLSSPVISVEAPAGSWDEPPASAPSTAGAPDPGVHAGELQMLVGGQPDMETPIFVATSNVAGPDFSGPGMIAIPSSIPNPILAPVIVDGNEVDPIKKLVRLFESLPAIVTNIAKALSTPEAGVIGAVGQLPGLGKMGMFVLQPLQPGTLKPDFSQLPTVFFSIPKRKIVFTYNFQTNEFESGGGSASPIRKGPVAGAVPRGDVLSAIKSIGAKSFVFYNVRGGGGGSGEDGRSTLSGNFGVLNGTVTDPLVSQVLKGLGAKIRTGARIAQAAGYVAAPETAGVTLLEVAAVEAIKIALIKGLLVWLDSADYTIGLAWRGAEISRYNNGETSLNLSGAKIRFSGGEGAGGSGLCADDFVFDFSDASD